MTAGWVLTLRSRPPLPLEVGSLVPGRLAAMSAAEVERLPLALGRRDVALGEFFKVTGGPGERLTFAGPCERLDGIGRGLASGEVVIEGDAGAETGAGQSGGEIHVMGSVGDGAALGMRSGSLIVEGSAGAFLGAAPPGERLGMRGGMIQVLGDVGPRAGERMRRGMILVAGNAAATCGARMLAGTIAVAGQVAALPGLRMRRGTIIAGRAAEGVPATFAETGMADLIVLRLMARRLARLAPWLEGLLAAGPLSRAAGDLAVEGKGEVLLAAR